MSPFRAACCLTWAMLGSSCSVPPQDRDLAMDLLLSPGFNASSTVLRTHGGRSPTVVCGDQLKILRKQLLRCEVRDGRMLRDLPPLAEWKSIGRLDLQEGVRNCSMYVFRHGQQFRITVPDFTSPTSTALVCHDRDAVIVSTLGRAPAK